MHFDVQETHTVEGVWDNRKVPQTKHDERLWSILNDIIRERESQATYVLINGPDDVQPPPAPFWPSLFQRAFLSTSRDDSGSGPRDDLLFYVPRNWNSKHKVNLKVFRHNSPNLPAFGSEDINWEETVYLNLLMQYFTYVVTIAVCTRTGPQELQILKKFSETVYASPSRRQMDGKGKGEEIVYPNLFFSVDNYDEAFAGCILRDSESLCVELTAYDSCGRMQGVCFLGTIQYSTLKNFYYSKVPPSRLSSTNILGRQFGSMTNNSFSSPYSQPRTVKFIQMTGPQSKGLAEVAVYAVDNPIRSSLLCLCHRTGSVRGTGADCCACEACGSAAAAAEARFDSFDAQSELERKVLEDCEASGTITRQPPKSPAGNSDRWPSNEVFADWLGLSPQSGPALIPDDDIDRFALHRAIPSMAKSAGASADTSPVRHWRSPSAAEICDRKRRMRTYNLSHGRRSSRVSEILNRFTSSKPTSTSDQPKAKDERDLGGSRLNEDSKYCSDGKPSRIVEENLDDRLNDGVLFSGPERTRRSFGQAWSWFKERRRIASIGLSASLTFLSLPYHSILVDLLEVRREPILNITD
ncbi:unnamed protein product [Calicophoron daubneyi]|uniref:Uncharacterized protein n=1 Tax=Calicophoron daubneyi TaxID=300641 RepID=A0AAV2T7F1_CALDB